MRYILPHNQNYVSSYVGGISPELLLKAGAEYQNRYDLTDAANAKLQSEPSLKAGIYLGDEAIRLQKVLDEKKAKAASAMQKRDLTGAKQAMYESQAFLNSADVNALKEDAIKSEALLEATRKIQGNYLIRAGADYYDPITKQYKQQKLGKPLSPDAYTINLDTFPAEAQAYGAKVLGDVREATSQNYIQVPNDKGGFDIKNVATGLYVKDKEKDAYGKKLAYEADAWHSDLNNIGMFTGLSYRNMHPENYQNLDKTPGTGQAIMTQEEKDMLVQHPSAKDWSEAQTVAWRDALGHTAPYWESIRKTKGEQSLDTPSTPSGYKAPENPYTGPSGNTSAVEVLIDAIEDPEIDPVKRKGIPQTLEDLNNLENSQNTNWLKIPENVISSSVPNKDVVTQIKDAYYKTNSQEEDVIGISNILIQSMGYSAENAKTKAETIVRDIDAQMDQAMSVKNAIPQIKQGIIKDAVKAVGKSGLNVKESIDDEGNAVMEVVPADKDIKEAEKAFGFVSGENPSDVNKIWAYNPKHIADLPKEYKTPIDDLIVQKLQENSDKKTELKHTNMGGIYESEKPKLAELTKERAEIINQYLKVKNYPQYLEALKSTSGYGKFLDKANTLTQERMQMQRSLSNFNPDFYGSSKNPGVPDESSVGHSMINAVSSNITGYTVYNSAMQDLSKSDNEADKLLVLATDGRGKLSKGEFYSNFSVETVPNSIVEDPYNGRVYVQARVASLKTANSDIKKMFPAGASTTVYIDATDVAKNNWKAQGKNEANLNFDIKHNLFQEAGALKKAGDSFKLSELANRMPGEFGQYKSTLSDIKVVKLTDTPNSKLDIYNKGVLIGTAADESELYTDIIFNLPYFTSQSGGTDGGKPQVPLIQVVQEP